MSTESQAIARKWAWKTWRQIPSAQQDKLARALADEHLIRCGYPRFTDVEWDKPATRRTWRKTAQRRHAKARGEWRKSNADPPPPAPSPQSIINALVHSLHGILAITNRNHVAWDAAHAALKAAGKPYRDAVPTESQNNPQEPTP